MKNKTPEYIAWENMLRRCSGRSKDSVYYASRGIKVCDQWKLSFTNFLRDMGSRPSPRHTLDRIDNDGDYEPGNVRWATMKQQSRNKRNNNQITFGGRTACIAEWADILGVPYRRLQERLRKGWPLELAMTAGKKSNQYWKQNTEVA